MPVRRRTGINLADLPGGKRHVNAGLTWVYTGYPVLNRALNARLRPTSADDRIRDVVERFGAWEAGVAWLVGPSTHPRALGRAIEAHGFALVGRWTGMALDLSRPVDARVARAGFFVHPIAGRYVALRGRASAMRWP